MQITITSSGPTRSRTTTGCTTLSKGAGDNLPARISKSLPANGMSCASNVSETKSFVTTTAQRRSKRRTTRSKMQARSDCGPRPTPSPISMISKWWPSEFREIFQKKPREVRSMSRFVSKSAVSFFAVVCFLLSGSTAPAQEIPSDYQEVLKSLDRKGDFKAGVLKVNIPRDDLKMTIQGFST